GEPFETIAPLVKGARGREGLSTGDTAHGVITAGLVMGIIHDIPTCEQLIQRIVSEAETIIKDRLARLVAQ
ncbi:MAG: nitronate monooxygenase, partial [Novosphingobium sp.]|nr:nitronate monooxygenase [Novosphingobium sp.]